MYRRSVSRLLVFLSFFSFLLLFLFIAGAVESPAQDEGEMLGGSAPVASGGGAEWLRVWSGTEDDHARGVAIDEAGNTYVVGWFGDSVDFDPGPYTTELTASGYTDAYLTKFDAAGTWQWAKSWGGPDDDSARDVAVDSSGNIYVVGTEFRKYRPNGELVWKREIEGYVLGECVTVDGSDNVYFAGTVGSPTDFDPGTRTAAVTPRGMSDAFVCKFTSNGEFQWVKVWGHDSEEFAINDIASDPSGNVFVTGAFIVTAMGGAVDFDPGTSVDERDANDNFEIFVSKFASNGNFQWVRTWGGSDSPEEARADMGFGVAADSSGAVYIVGRYYGQCDFNPGPGTTTRTANGIGSYLSKLDSSGTFVWVRAWDGASAYDVALKSDGGIFVTGTFSEPADFDPGEEAESPRECGHGDMFLSRFSSTGEFEWVRTHCTMGLDMGRRIEVNPYGQAVIAGSVGGGEPFTEEGRQPNGYDAFVYVFNDRG